MNKDERQNKQWQEPKQTDVGRNPQAGAPGEERHVKPWDDKWRQEEGWDQPVEDSGVEGMDQSAYHTPDGGYTGQDTSTDSGGIYTEGSAVTADGDIAIDGGHLPGTQDTFEGELKDAVPREPGAGDQANTGTHQNATRQDSE
jgi:hypothetical protein